MKKVLRIILMSCAICFSLTFALILINALMGIFIRLNYYFAMASLLTIALSICIVLVDSKKIFSKKTKTSSRVNASNDIKTQRHDTLSSRRKIS